MGNLIKGCPSVMYLFSHKVYATNKKTGIELAKATVRRCEDFADAYHIHFHADSPIFFDGQLFVRFIFQVQEPQDTILMKVSAIFNLAALLKLELINQEFFPK